MWINVETKQSIQYNISEKLTNERVCEIVQNEERK